MCVVVHTQMRCSESQRGELGEWGCYVMTEQRSQRGIKMFQTNITPRALVSGARQQCTLCLPLAFEQKKQKKNRGGQAGRQSVMQGENRGACLGLYGCVSESRRLWFQSVTVSRDCGSSSPPLSPPALLGPAPHLLCCCCIGTEAG